MGEASGLRPREVEVLSAIERLGGAVTGIRCDRVVAELGGDDSYATLLGLAQPWVVHLATVTVAGNLGTAEFEAADPEYTNCRLGALGVAALGAERGGPAPLPIGLINGDLHHGGTRPPFDPARVIAAIERAHELDDAAVIDAVGPPAFPTGCEVVTDGGVLVARAVVSAEADDRLVVSHLPPGCSVGAIAHEIMQRITGSSPGERPPVVDASDEWTGSSARLVVRGRPGAIADVERFVRSLRATTCRWDLGDAAPPAATLRRFAGDDAAELQARLAPVRSAIRRA